MKRLPKTLEPTLPTDLRSLTTPVIRKQIEVLFEQYTREVHAAELSAASKGFYIDFARCFIRWVDREFQPGSQVPGRRDTFGTR